MSGAAADVWCCCCAAQDPLVVAAVEQLQGLKQHLARLEAPQGAFQAPDMHNSVVQQLLELHAEKQQHQQQPGLQYSP
jgi:hypothetical protein